jgi:uncharacterized protein (TIGR03435 family)
MERQREFCGRIGFDTRRYSRKGLRDHEDYLPLAAAAYPRSRPAAQVRNRRRSPEYNAPSASACKPLSQPGPPPADITATPNIKVACRNLSGAAIAENLRQMAGGYLDHDVVDSTGLEGSWDFDLEWTPRGALTAKGAEGISVFTAVDKQR